MAVWSEVDFPELSPTMRLDAEYYQPAFLDNVRFLQQNCRFPVEQFGDALLSISGGATPLGAEYPEDGVPFLRVQNIMQGFLNLDDVVYVSPEVHSTQLKRSQLQPNDVLLTITGVSYGKAAFVPSDLGSANINQHSVRMQFKEYLHPEYVAMFLNCRFGKLQSDMKITGVTRPALDYGEIGTFLIPILPDELQREVIELCEKSQHQRIRSLELYAEAETLLLDALGLNDLEATHAIAYERNFSEVARAGRFDAQYYHPEKYEVLEALDKLEGQTIGDYFPSRNDIINATDDFAPEVQNYDLTDALSFFLPDIDVMPTSELGSNKKRFQRGDVVVSRLRSYLKEIALVEASSPACVGSTEFIVLRPHPASDVSPELLLVYLRSEPVQKILRWCQDGSQHPRFKEDELLSIKLPDRLLTVQESVKVKVREAIQSFYDAQSLLENAKQRVEELIEGG